MIQERLWAESLKYAEWQRDKQLKIGRIIKNLYTKRDDLHNPKITFLWRNTTNKLGETGLLVCGLLPLEERLLSTLGHLGAINPRVSKEGKVYIDVTHKIQFLEFLSWRSG